MEKDTSRKTVEKTLNQITNIKNIFAKRYAFGPRHVKMDRRESRRMIQNMSDEQRQSMFNTIGKDKWDSMMQDMYNG
jgi:hypothetical protein